MRRPAAAMAAALLAVPARSPAEAPKVLSIAAAADLRYALEEIATGFEAAHPGVSVRRTYGSSGGFVPQIEGGAPFDLFLSADAAAVAHLEAEGLALPGSAFTYAFGRLVVWVPRSSPLDLERLGARALLDPSVRRVAIANPAHAPYGRAAEQALAALGLRAALQDRLVLGENVSQAAQFVESGNAQAGLVALSLALAPPMRERGRTWEVPREAYAPIEQRGVVVRKAAAPDLARAFAAALRSPPAAAVLERYGFVLPR